MKKTLMLIFLALGLSLAISCGGKMDSEYTVTYDGNGNDLGDVPSVSGWHFLKGDTVKVSGNSEHLEKTSYEFSGWKTSKKHNGADYVKGDELTIGSSDVTLYAVWYPEIPSVGLVGEWLFEGNTFDTNILSTTHIGTVTGADLSADRFENAYFAYTFSATDKITFPEASVFDTTLDLSYITISFFINPTVIPADIGEIIMKDDGVSNLAYQIKLGSNNTIIFNYCTTGLLRAAMTLNSTSAIPLNKWTHVVIKYDGTTAYIYINGVLDKAEDATTSGPLQANNCSIVIGKGITSSFEGAIDDVRIYSSALTAAEISLLYQEQDWGNE